MMPSGYCTAMSFSFLEVVVLNTRRMDSKLANLCHANDSDLNLMSHQFDLVLELY